VTPCSKVNQRGPLKRRSTTTIHSVKTLNLVKGAAEKREIIKTKIINSNPVFTKL
jgi:hypothetical protein